MIVQTNKSLPIGVQNVFSALPANIAREIEPIYAQAGYAVCSNASAFRCGEDVPVIIPEINHDHIALLNQQ